MGEIQDRGVGGGFGHVVALAINSKTHNSQNNTLIIFIHKFSCLCAEKQHNDGVVLL